MHVIDHTTLAYHSSEGRQRVAVADQRLGVDGFEVWIERLTPWAHAAFGNPHGTDQVVLVTCGRGKLVVDESIRHFVAPCSLLVPARCQCEIHNTGLEQMLLVVAFPTR